jgi:hypothetical protein
MLPVKTQTVNLTRAAFIGCKHNMPSYAKLSTQLPPLTSDYTASKIKNACGQPNATIKRIIN